MSSQSDRTAACPSCGAPLRFRGATSVVAVCAFCRATLVRDGANVEDIGKQAELLEDQSPLQVGAFGKHRGANFQVVGRIQYRYGAGAWNEWYVLFDDRKGAWLSDASREYTISYPAPPEAVPAYEKLQVEQQLTLDGRRYTVTNLESAEVVAGEGELPFRFQAGWKAPVADLRGKRAEFATIDYSDEPPRIYTGEKLPYEAFDFFNVRDPEHIGFTGGRAFTFKCGGCGSPIEKQLATTEVVACVACGTVSDVTKGVGEVVQRQAANEQLFKPPIPLGATGSWKSVPYEVVGVLRRGVTVDGVDYDWTEYLLHNVQQGYAWITEYNGHFNFVKNAAEQPGKAVGVGNVKRINYLGRAFTLFQSARAKVKYLAGEFYWRVKRGDEAAVEDYVAPPLVLSSEKTGNEITWSLGEYASGAEIYKAFGVKGTVPPPMGIAPNQPSPHSGKVARFWKLFGILLLVAFVTQLAFGALSLVADPARGWEFPVTQGQSQQLVTEPFNVGGVLPAPLTTRITTNAHDNWVIVNLQLTEVSTGQAYGVKRQLGVSKVGGQAQGYPDDVVEIPSVPPGRYTLTVNATAAPPTANNWPSEIRVGVNVANAPVDWGNFWLLAAFLLLWPIAATWRSVSFESRRWSESDVGSIVLGGGGAASSDDD